MQGGKSTSCTVFVGNIPYDAEEDELRNVFSRVGSVESLRLVFDKDTNAHKGYGFCDYADPETAMSAIRNLNDVEFNGRRLRIDLADKALRNQSAKGGFVPLALPAPPSLAATPQQTPSVGAASGAPLTSMPGAAPVSAQREATAAADESTPDIMAEDSVHTEIARKISAMPQAQLQLCLGTMQRLAVEAPESARALLQEHPQLCYALLHAQLLLGLAVDPVPPPGADEMVRLRAQHGRLPMVARHNPMLGFTGALRAGVTPGMGMRPMMTPGMGMLQPQMSSLGFPAQGAFMMQPAFPGRFQAY